MIICLYQFINLVRIVLSGQMPAGQRLSVKINGEWLMVKESLRKFASGSAEDTGKCCGFLLGSFCKVCVRKW